MIVPSLGIISYGFTLLFGVAVSVSFAGIEHTRKNYIAVGCFSTIALLLQIAAWKILGFDITTKLYPIIIHLPLIIFIAVCFKRSWLISAASVFSSYLCCQVPRWLGDVAGAISNSSVVNHICYIAAMFFVYYFLYKYVAGSVRKLMEKSTKSCMLFGAVPLFYYLFDYATTVYTDLLYQGSRGAVQFMPSVVSVFYFVFVIIYYAETKKQTAAQRERDMLVLQLHHAQTEFASLRQMQQSAIAYRHDMRHHFALLQALTSEGSMEKIREYLKTAQSDMDAITPMRFCENETVNLILSCHAAKAKQAGVTLTVDAVLPKILPFSDTELCSLLFNGLENAVTAASVADLQCKTLFVKALVYKEKLLISIENPYSGTVVIKDGLPQSSSEGHGFGTRSISAIANAHGGQAIFSAGGGIFTLKVMLSLRE